MSAIPILVTFISYLCPFRSIPTWTQQVHFVSWLELNFRPLFQESILIDIPSQWPGWLKDMLLCHYLVTMTQVYFVFSWSWTQNLLTNDYGVMTSYLCYFVQGEKKHLATKSHYKSVRNVRKYFHFSRQFTRSFIISGQSYKHFTIINYDSRVVIWANL